MSYNWGPYFIVPSETLKTFSGRVLLREKYDEELLKMELNELGFSGAQIKATNPWYYRKKGSETWIKIGESSDKKDNFSVAWNTDKLENGDYELLGLMHVFIKTEDEEIALARQNIADVVIAN